MSSRSRDICVGDLWRRTMSLSDRLNFNTLPQKMTNAGNKPIEQAG